MTNDKGDRSPSSHIELIQRAVCANLIDPDQAEQLLRRDRANQSFVDLLQTSGFLANDRVDQILDLIGPESFERGTDAESLVTTRTFRGRGEVACELRLDGLPPRYVIEAEIGKGGMGRVYRAFDKELNRRVAVKVLLAATHRSRYGQLMQRERQVMAALDEPGIVAVFDSGQLADGSPFYVMQLVPGENLKEFVEREKLDTRQILRLVKRIAVAMHKAHLLNIVHRDLKPQNIRVTPDGDPKILDFGLAKYTDEPSAKDQDPCPSTSQIELTARAAGTPAYMSPEQAAGQQVDARADVYALGVILYELLSDKLPFDPSNLARLSSTSLSDALTDHNIPPLAQVVRRLPREVGAIVDKCLAKSPHTRYANAGQLAADLDCYLNNLPVSAVARWRGLHVLGTLARRHRWKALAGLATLAIILTTVTIAFYRVTQEKNIADRQRDKAIRNEDIAKQQREIANQQHRRAEKSEEEVRDERDKLATQLQKGGTQRASRFLRQRRYDEARSALGDVPESRRGWEHARMAYEIAMAPFPDSVVGHHEWPIWDLLVSDDGKTVVTSGQDGRVMAWDVQSGEATVLEPGLWSDRQRRWRHAIIKLQGDNSTAPDGFVRLCWLPDQDAVAGVSLHGKAVVWNLETAERKVLYRHDRHLNAVAAAPNGRFLIADDQGNVLTASLENPGEVSELWRADSPVLCAVHIEADIWCLGHEDGVVRVLDAATQKVVTETKLAEPIRDVIATGDKRRLAVAGGLPFAVIYQVAADGQISEDMRLALPDFERKTPRAVHSICFSRNADRLFAVDDLGRLVAWELANKELVFARPDQVSRPLVAEVTSRWPLSWQGRLGVIRTSDDGQRVFTAGQNTVVKKWNLAARDGTTRLRVAANPRMAFSREDASQFWLGDATGAVSLIDSKSGRTVNSVQGHDGPIASITLARNANLAATCCRETIRFWRQGGDQLEGAYATIRHQRPLRSISLAPSAEYVVAYDASDEVHLWEVASGKHLHQCSMRTGRRAVGGLVGFNADGSLIAAAGPGQAVWILEAGNLQPIAKPYLANGEGATAIAWHPQQPRRLVGGDTTGILFEWPEAQREYPPIRGKRIVDVSYTPGGDRYAAAASDGSVLIADPKWLGVVHSFSAKHENGAAIREAHFDPSGNRLLLAYADGLAQIFETGDPRARQPAAEHQREWTQAKLYEAPADTEVVYREPSVQIDSQGRVSMLAAEYVKDAPTATSGSCRLFVIHQTENGPTQIELERVSVPDGHTMYQIRRSLALQVLGEETYAIFRRPRPDLSAFSGELVLCRSVNRGRFEMSVITEPDNYGFDSHIVLDRRGNPVIFHFSHYGNYLKATRLVDDQWQTVTVGRQGIGLRSKLAENNGLVHIISNSIRFNGDERRSQYARLDLDDWPFENVDFESITRSYRATPFSITVGPNAQPRAFYRRSSETDADQLLVARQTPAGWALDIVVTQAPRPGSRSQIVSDSNGDHMAFFDRLKNELQYIRIKPDKLVTEKIWSRETSSQASPTPYLPLILRLDEQGNPTVIYANSSGANTSISLFSPET